MPNDDAYEAVRSLIRSWLQQAPLASDELLNTAYRRGRLFREDGRLPEWLAFRQFSFRWRIQSRFEGASSRFLLWERSASAREMLDAEIRIDLRPVPFYEPVPKPLAREVESQVHFPCLLRRSVSPEEFKRLAPAGATPRTTTILQADSQSWACWDDPTQHSDELAQRLRVRWIRDGKVWDIPPESSWPVALFLSLTRALASPHAALTGDSAPFTHLNTTTGVWDLARRGLTLNRMFPDWLASPATSLDDPLLNPMRSSWTVDGYSVRAGALVNTAGALADVTEDDTFLVPFRIEQEIGSLGPVATLFLELPDILPHAQLREILIRTFRDRADFEDAADAINNVTSKNFVSEAELRALCDSTDQGVQVLRVDRKEDGEYEEYLLVVEAKVGAMALAILFHANDVALQFENGQFTAPRIGKVRLIFAGHAEGSILNWDDFDPFPFRRPRAQLFADVMAILMRWRALL